MTPLLFRKKFYSYSKLSRAISQINPTPAHGSTNAILSAMIYTMIILGVETSCDETGMAIVEATGGLKNPRFKVLKNLVASQIKIHRPFGGVVPNLAKREHLRNLPLLWQRIMNNELRIKHGNKKTIIHNSKFIIPKFDLIAVTVGPGLEPALWTGIEFAKTLIHAEQTRNNADGAQTNTENFPPPSAFIPRSSAYGPRKSAPLLVGANHLEGHLYSFLLPKKTAEPKLKIRNVLNSKFYILNSGRLFPAIALIVSGGHTILLKMDSLSRWKKLGETRDDAAGEAFDKVARLLRLPYPGGPEIEKLAMSGDPAAINFPRPMLNDKNLVLKCLAELPEKLGI